MDGLGTPQDILATQTADDNLLIQPPQTRWPTLARNCWVLGLDRHWGDSVAELFGFGLEALDL